MHTKNEWRYWYIILRREDGEQVPILRYAPSIADALKHAYPDHFESVLIREATEFEISKNGDSFKM